MAEELHQPVDPDDRKWRTVNLRTPVTTKIWNLQPTDVLTIWFENDREWRVLIESGNGDIKDRVKIEHKHALEVKPVVGQGP